MDKSLIFCLCLFISGFNLHADDPLTAVIVSYGALGVDEIWFEPTGDFYEQLNATAKGLYPNSPNFMDVCKTCVPDYKKYLPANIENLPLDGCVVFPFHWDQPHDGLTIKEQIDGGKNMAEFIIHLIKAGFNKIDIVVHSYGGHVAKIAGHYLSDDNTYGISPHICYSSDYDMRRLDGELEDADLHFEREKSKISKLKEFLKSQLAPILRKKRGVAIDVLHTLATPNVHDFTADMAVIGELYNHYSEGDLVDRAAGHLELPDNTVASGRAVDFSIKNKGRGWWFFHKDAPTHIHMHDPIVGKNVLKIPERLKRRRKGGFQNFDFDHKGEISYQQNMDDAPNYKKGKAYQRGFNLHQNPMHYQPLPGYSQQVVSSVYPQPYQQSPVESINPVDTYY